MSGWVDGSGPETTGAVRPACAAAGAAPVYGALDLGTNNCRLLLARPTADGFRTIDSFSRIVRLGESLSLTGRLADAAIERTMDALAVCRAKLATRGVTRSLLVATEACRAAGNGEAFVRRVQDDLGLELTVVDRETEATLAASGSASLADPEASGVLLFDIGGGSSEIVWLAAAEAGVRAGNRSDAIRRRMRSWTSLPLGVVSLADRFGGQDVDEPKFEAMVGFVSEALRGFTDETRGRTRCPRFHLLGTSGTVTTVAGFFLGLERYDRRRVDGLWMSSDDVSRAIAALKRMPFEARAAQGCIGRDRADLVLAGCAILEAIRRAFPCERLRIADRGLREGILLSMMETDGAWDRFAGRAS